jgi:hypothetical protein
MFAVANTFENIYDRCFEVGENAFGDMALYETDFICETPQADDPFDDLFGASKRELPQDSARISFDDYEEKQFYVWDADLQSAMEPAEPVIYRAPVQAPVDKPEYTKQVKPKRKSHAYVDVKELEKEQAWKQPKTPRPKKAKKTGIVLPAQYSTQLVFWDSVPPLMRVDVGPTIVPPLVFSLSTNVGRYFKIAKDFSARFPNQWKPRGDAQRSFTEKDWHSARNSLKGVAISGQAWPALQEGKQPPHDAFVMAQFGGSWYMMNWTN